MNTYLIALLIAITMMKSINGQNTPMICYEDGYWINSFDGHYAMIKREYFFNGKHSYHHDHYEDRRFKFRYCTPPTTPLGRFSGANSVLLPDTAYDAEWTRTCSNLNGGDAAIHGIESWHHNHYEDRQFRIYCGLLDKAKHRLANCFYLPVLNTFDGVVDYDCPNNGVIRSIWSKHHNHYEDRLWKFECCNIMDNEYGFSNIVGEWAKQHSCLGCAQHQFMKQFGTESSTVETVESTYSNELSSTVSVGFKFKKIFSASIEVSGTVSESISRSMQSAFTTSYSESTTFTCEMTYLYQWLVSGDETRSDGIFGRFKTYSNDYLCTNNPDPKCPPGYCSDSDCETCTVSF